MIRRKPPIHPLKLRDFSVPFSPFNPFDPFQPGSVFTQRGTLDDLARIVSADLARHRYDAMRAMTPEELAAWRHAQWEAAMNAARPAEPVRRPEKVRGKVDRGRINIDLAPEEYRRR